MPAIVPGSILSTMMHNGHFNISSSPYHQTDLRSIPDISETGPEYYTYTFKLNFTLDNALSGCEASDNKRIFLKFRGINYRADISINQQVISSSSSISGMFIRRNLELTEHLLPSNEVNTLEVTVFPPDHVGLPNGDQGGDHEIARNGAIHQFVAGWDWIQNTPDRNTGMFDKVSLVTTANVVALRDPHVLANDIDINKKSASLTTSVTLNFDPDSPLSQEDKVLVEVSVFSGYVFTLIANASTVVLLEGQTTKQIQLPKMDLTDVQFWYPHTLAELGGANLYMIRFEVKIYDVLSDSITFNYGIREITPYIHPVTQGQAFKVNNVDIFIVGGNWIVTDQFLGYSKGDKESYDRYYNEVKMHRDMGFNIIRVWGGGIHEREEFYQACDELGIMVFQEYWMTGDNNGRWGGNYSWPDDHSSYLDNIQDAIISTRNHPSLLLWCWGNELSPEGQNPSSDIANGITNLLKQYDPGRFFIPSSMSPQSFDPSDFDPSYALANTDGPYTPLLETQWYQERNPGLVGYNMTPIAFQPEVGSVSTPTFESLRKFLNERSLQKFPSKYAIELDEVDDAWSYHKYLTYTTVMETGEMYDHIYSYGAPNNTYEYCLRAQIVQFSQFKALFEGYRLHQSEWYSAVLFWKSQSPWPALRGALYDYYLAQTGGYFGVRRALEPDSAFHIQLNPATLVVSIVNNHPIPYYDLSYQVICDVFTFSGNLVYSKNYSVDIINANEVITFSEAPLEWPSSTLTDQSVLLYVFSLEGSYVERNYYWMSDPSKQFPDYSLLGNIRDTAMMLRNGPRLGVESVNYIMEGHKSIRCMISIGNLEEVGKSEDDYNVAFMVTYSLHHGNKCEGIPAESKDLCDDRQLPSYYKDNYLLILPGEWADISVTGYASPGEEFSEHDDSWYLKISGWNVEEMKIPLSITF